MTSIPWKTNIKVFLHGADYNPEQWSPEVWREDVRLMKKAGFNAASIGIFSWSHLEPEEGKFEFTWLDEVIALLKENGVFTVLATPSGARPPWLSQKYPEVLRVNEMGIHNLYGMRHNHCPTSPIYRSKVAEINRRLAERYGANDAVILWHVSNEYGGKCYCPLCQAAFREWLRKHYGTLDNLNAAWWTSFWSHRFTDWEQIDAPSRRGEFLLHGLTRAWHQFITDQTIDFYRAEVTALRIYDKRTPMTTNFHGYNNSGANFDYFQFAKEVDVVSWDSYPKWHSTKSDVAMASATAIRLDMNRSMKGGLPFLLMESTPSNVGADPVTKPKRPGMHLLSSLQAVAHGSDSVQYFQWRKCRGGAEKFQGAVIDHCGHDDTRVFKEVAEVGNVLSKIKNIVDSRIQAEAAVIYDWNNHWAINDYQGWRNDKKYYFEEVHQYYQGLWNISLPLDCIGEECDLLDHYKLIVAPMLYLLKPMLAERLKAFVSKGGTLVTTYCSAVVDNDDLVFAGGQPGPLRSLLGLWVEEADSLYDGETVRILTKMPSLHGEYVAREICERIRLESAVPLAHYGSEFYAGEPCLSVNQFGKGKAYYVAFRTEDRFVNDFLSALAAELKLESNWSIPLPSGVNVQRRSTLKDDYFFVMNFNSHKVIVQTPAAALIDEINNKKVSTEFELPPYGLRILRKAK